MEKEKDGKKHVNVATKREREGPGSGLQGNRGLVMGHENNLDRARRKVGKEANELRDQGNRMRGVPIPRAQIYSFCFFGLHGVRI
jgi:hypothetical protein